MTSPSSREAESDWVIVIPSYNRVDTLQKKTLALLQSYKIPKAKIYIFVANEEQEELYKPFLKDVGHIVVGVKGLTKVRNYIYGYFPKGKHLVWMDDDITGILEYDANAKRHEKPLSSLEKVITRGFAECKKAGAKLWGVYPSPNGFFMKDTVSTDLRFIIGSFWGCVNPGSDPKYQLKFGVGEKEDYQRTIQYWEADGVVVRLNFISPKTAYYKGTGGLQSNDRLERERRTVKAMMRKWPQYIKINPNRKSGYPEIRLMSPPPRGAEAEKRTTRKKPRSK